MNFKRKKSIVQDGFVEQTYSLGATGRHQKFFLEKSARKSRLGRITFPRSPASLIGNSRSNEAFLSTGGPTSGSRPAIRGRQQTFTFKGASKNQLQPQQAEKTLLRINADQDAAKLEDQFRGY